MVHGGSLGRGGASHGAGQPAQGDEPHPGLLPFVVVVDVSVVGMQHCISFGVPYRNPVFLHVTVWSPHWGHWSSVTAQLPTAVQRTVVPSPFPPLPSPPYPSGSRRLNL